MKHINNIINKIFIKKEGEIKIKKENNDMFFYEEDPPFNRFVKFTGFCLVSGTVFGLIKSSRKYQLEYRKNIYVPSNLFEKYSLFYSNKFLLNGSLLFYGSYIINKIFSNYNSLSQ